jgi:polyhydroxyalkanoate synthesis regulator phasin
VLHVAELVKQSEIYSEKARKYARDVELQAERIKIELGRLDMLLDFDFEDSETKKLVEKVKALRKMVNDAKAAGEIKK